MVADWVHIFGAGSVFNLRGGYTNFLEWSYSAFATGFDATEFWPNSLVQQFPSGPLGGVFPQIELDQYATLSRGTNSNRNRNWSLQPNVSLNRGNHNIRSGLDLRWINVHNENYNNSGGLVQFNRDFTRRTLGSTAALEGNAFASFLLGAPSGGTVDINPVAHYKWFFAAPWIQDDWRVSNRLTVNLGFRWDINGSVTEENDMLNYAFDPTIVNPVSARLRSAGDGGHPVRRRGRRAGSALEARQEQLAGPRRYGLLAQREDRVTRRLRQVLPQPDQSGQQCRVLLPHGSDWLD